jgi:putative peptidoglycan lipid II flippase
MNTPNPLETTSEASERVQVAQAAGVIALGNVFSRLLGLLWVVVKSWLFGAGPDVSALDAAVRVPKTIYELLVGGMVTSALVPVLSDYAPPSRRRELWELLGMLVSLALLVVSGFLVVGEILAPQLVWLMAGGLSAPTQSLATELLRLVLPSVLFLSLAGILSGALYALKRFVFPAFTAAIFNAAMVALALVMGRQWGVHSVAIGLVVGALLQVLLQLPGLRGARIRFVIDLRHPALRRVGKLYLPILIGLVVDNLLSVVLSYNLASRLGDSAISWMEYAAQIIQFPLGFVVAAISIAILPTLSRHASAQETGPFRTTLNEGLRLVLALVIPATIGLFVLARPIVALVFEHGDWTPADTVAVSEALRYHLVGLIFASVDQLLIFAFYARKDTLTPALVGVVTTVLYAVAALTLAWAGVLTLPLLILVNSLKWAAHAIIMLVLTRRHLGELGERRVWGLTGKATAASAVMAGVVWWAQNGVTALAFEGLLGELSVVLGPGIVGLLVYGLLGVMLRMEEIHVLREAVVDGAQRLTRLILAVIIPPPEKRSGRE